MLCRTPYPAQICCPYAFDRVNWRARACDTGEIVEGSVLGPVWSEYQSGPSLFDLAREVAAQLPHIPGGYWVGLESARPLGFQYPTQPKEARP